MYTFLGKVPLDKFYFNFSKNVKIESYVKFVGIISKLPQSQRPN